MIHIISPKSYINIWHTVSEETKKDKTLITPYEQMADGIGIQLGRYLRKLDCKHKIYTLLGGFNGYKLRTLCKREHIRLKYIRTIKETPQKWIIQDKNKKDQQELMQDASYSNRNIKAFQQLILKDLLESKTLLIDTNLPAKFPTDFFDPILEKINTEKSAIPLFTIGYHPFLESTNNATVNYWFITKSEFEKTTNISIKTQEPHKIIQDKFPIIKNAYIFDLPHQILVAANSSTKSIPIPSELESPANLQSAFIASLINTKKQNPTKNDIDSLALKSLTELGRLTEPTPIPHQ